MTTDAGRSPSPLGGDYTPEERGWLREDWRDPRADCPQRDQHAHRVYGGRWRESSPFSNRWPTLDGRSVAKTHRQIRCEGCNRFMVWLPKSDDVAASSTGNPAG